ncbi:hypothetical protein [Bacillus haynesii]|uniref:hypothetical protein n=1 Tax=Bacillus haynesii TaxID=1925021 RepID=UPI00228236E6|nr:hypothetical protein [Bacillus haynesii]MCY9324031.1 hypothetical protein [Bacillus haynesii]
MYPVYLNDWEFEWIREDWRRGDVDSRGMMMADFGITEEDMKGVEVILASYTYEDYEGDAFVLFRKDGKYYEVHGSHCSCYGLEDQWEPEEAVLKELEHRVTEGRFGRNWDGNNSFAKELKLVLKQLKLEGAYE